MTCSPNTITDYCAFCGGQSNEVHLSSPWPSVRRWPLCPDCCANCRELRAIMAARPPRRDRDKDAAG